MTTHKYILLKLSRDGFYRLKKAVEEMRFNEIEEQLDYKWTDIDSPSGEKASASSPFSMWG
jgi:hypothetical protein